MKKYQKGGVIKKLKSKVKSKAKQVGKTIKSKYADFYDKQKAKQESTARYKQRKSIGYQKGGGVTNLGGKKKPSLNTKKEITKRIVEESNSRGSGVKNLGGKKAPMFPTKIVKDANSRGKGAILSPKRPLGMQKGGSMKSVPAGKKFNGLRSLPTDVRNKMGYAKYGSVVKGGSLRRSRKH